MSHNYFADLEVPPNSSFEEVKAAHRRLTRKYHPDFNKGIHTAADSFRRIQEAFEALYPKVKSIDAIPILSRKNPRTMSSAQKAAYEKNRPPMVSDLHPNPLDLVITVQVRRKKALFGRRQKKIVYPYEQVCIDCQGKGRSYKEETPCKSCGGMGSLRINRGAVVFKQKCLACAGSGFESEAACNYCHSSGKRTHKQVLKLKTPKELDFEKFYQLPNLGHYSGDGKKRGNIWIQFKPKSKKS